MKKIYSKPSSLVINLEAEQMIAASGIGGTGADYPIVGASSHKSYGFDWDSEPFEGQESDIWK